ncbi:MAG TPA: amidohydrolase family protein, partial [Polyangiaceae bacterium]
MPRSRNRNFWLDPQAQDPEIHDHVEQIQIVDSHEHLDEERVRLEGPNNLTRFFLYYTFSDVVSAGLPDMPGGTFFNHGMSGEEQWTLIRNYWPLVKHSAFCRAVTLSIRELYDIEDLRDDTILPLLEAIAKKNQPGVTEWILREKCGIECSFINCEDPGDLARRTDHPGLFLPVLGVSAFCSDKMPIDKYQRSTGVSIASLKDWTRMIDWYFERWGGHVVSLKNVCGYWRSLHFENVAESEAGAVFEKWLLRGQSATETERRMLQDFNFHYCIRRAIDYGLPVQIHTGYHSGSNYMDLNLLWLRDLCNLFRDYPSARFVLIHTGYPEGQELIALCKHYRNVFADLSWTWAIDPEAS